MSDAGMQRKAMQDMAKWRDNFERRDAIIVASRQAGIPCHMIATALGIGTATVSRVSARARRAGDLPSVGSSSKFPA
jgi:transposase